MSEIVNRTLSVEDGVGGWFDTTTADLREAAQQFAEHMGWQRGSYSVSRLPQTNVPLGKTSLAVAFRRFRTYGGFGSATRSRVETQTTAEGFITPKT